MPHGFSIEPFFHYAGLSLTRISTGLLATYQGIFPQTFASVIANVCVSSAVEKPHGFSAESPHSLHLHALFPPRVGIMSSMERRQASRRDTNVQDQPACVEMSPMTVLARMAVPKKYPKKPVRPAAVPAAFLGTRSRACTPTSMTGP